MQEEVERQAVSIAISTTKLTGRVLFRGLQLYLAHRNNKKIRKTMEKQSGEKGRQTVKELLKSGDGVDSLELANGSAGRFCRIAKKLGVDYAIRKDKTVDPPRYLVFFKAKEDAVLQQVLKEYTAKTLNQRESILHKLRTLTAEVKSRADPARVLGRTRERTQNR